MRNPEVDDDDDGYEDEFDYERRPMVAGGAGGSYWSQGSLSPSGQRSRRELK